jgi:hypothetical protein
MVNVFCCFTPDEADLVFFSIERHSPKAQSVIGDFQLKYRTFHCLIVRKIKLLFGTFCFEVVFEHINTNTPGSFVKMYIFQLKNEGASFAYIDAQNRVKTPYFDDHQKGAHKKSDQNQLCAVLNIHFYTSLGLDQSLSAAFDPSPRVFEGSGFESV